MERNWVGNGGAGCKGVEPGNGFHCWILSPAVARAAQQRAAQFTAGDIAGGELRSPHYGQQGFPHGMLDAVVIILVPTRAGSCVNQAVLDWARGLYGLEQKEVSQAGDAISSCTR